MSSIKLIPVGRERDPDLVVCSRLGIALTKIMVLQYSNQETSVTIGESVRDEDGTLLLTGAVPGRLVLSGL